MNNLLITKEQEKELRTIADEVVATLTRIAERAEEEILQGQGVRQSPIIYGGFDTNILATQKITKARSQNIEGYQQLAKEPALVRVVVTREDGTGENTYYITRSSTVTGVKQLASYRSPVGRLAAIDLGDSIVLNGSEIFVVEKIRLKPKKKNEQWDSIKSIYEHSLDFPPLTIESLQALLDVAKELEFDENLLDSFLKTESVGANITQGIKRDVITKMGLRDQPILDRIQDEIFRLPINSQLLLLGPPGTGKTTTLIRRLSQKLDVEHLELNEKHLINTDNHAIDWLMFTPTVLLKHYLKEAFAREKVPASDRQVFTWDDYSRNLARRVFGFLKMSDGRGSFTLRTKLKNLQISVQNSAIEWFDDFNAFQQEEFINGFVKAANELAESNHQEVCNIGIRLQDLLADTKNIASIIEGLMVSRVKIKVLYDELVQSNKKQLRGMANLQLNKNKNFFHELADFINMQQTQNHEETQDEDLLEEDEEEAVEILSARDAYNKYSQVLRSHARATANNRSIKKDSLNGKIIEWLGEQNFNKEERRLLGQKLITQTYLRRFLNPVDAYLKQMPQRYKAFRRIRAKSGEWYIDKSFASSDIHPLELDILLLTTLRAGRHLYARRSLKHSLDQGPFEFLNTVVQQFKTQILVDEATDFSPIQLACMAALASPKLNSFIACGDFNQRLTTWGARTAEQINWVSPNIIQREINVAYRQSKQLNELANKLVNIFGASNVSAELPKNMSTEGKPPALLEYTKNREELAGWLAQRVVEIESELSSLPSVAIFVNSEEEVAPIASLLGEKLEDYSLQVVACLQGQSVGQDNDIRVFDIQHIKGLEFEAAFYVGIDELANVEPELFDKYLYVGVTRAATFLGVTCTHQLPEKLEVLRPLFSSGWK